MTTFGIKLFPNKKLGVALGGGIARGIAHVGVLKALVQAGIQIDYLSGVSSGALIGAAFAAGVSILDIEKSAIGRWWGNFVKIALNKRGATSNESIGNFLIRYIGDVNFSKLKIPLRIAATDLISGERVVFSQGKVADAVRASCSMPGIFIPSKIDSKLLVDGGISGNLPVAEAFEMGAEKVIAVEVMPNIKLKEEPRDMVSIVDRSITLLFRNSVTTSKQNADLVIEPVVENIGLLDLGKAKQLIAMGECATLQVLPQIKKLIAPFSF